MINAAKMKRHAVRIVMIVNQNKAALEAAVLLQKKLTLKN
jgi:hypothetical protein